MFQKTIVACAAAVSLALLTPASSSAFHHCHTAGGTWTYPQHDTAGDHTETGYWGVPDCLLAYYGKQDYGAQVWASHYSRDITDHVAVSTADFDGSKSWPMTDSLGRTFAYLRESAGGFQTVTSGGSVIDSASSGNVILRAVGCQDSSTLDSSHMLVQIKADDGSGTQAFVARSAFSSTIRSQISADTGCGSGQTALFAGPIGNPGVSGNFRDGGGDPHPYTTYNAKPEYGNVFYLNVNSTDVQGGGIVRGLIRVGDNIDVEDERTYCDKNRYDGPGVKWWYIGVPTGNTDRPKIYGWVPVSC
jgi:hypothetical protein